MAEGALLEQRLIDLLWDERLPDTVVARARDRRNIKVQDTLKVARAEVGDVPALESALDFAVLTAGGERMTMIDPYRWLPDLVGWLLRRERPPRDDYYSLPQSPNVPG